jgi:hypothetical protein
MTNKPKLTLIGDAWIYGTWRTERLDIPDELMNFEHSVPDQPGMSEWLGARYDVVVDFYDSNRGMWFDAQRVKDADHSGPVIVFQSDTSLRFNSDVFDVRYSDVAKNCENLEDFYSQIVDEYYCGLDQAAAESGIKIYMCGSVTDLDAAILSKYSNLVNLCTSWVQLVCPSHVPSPMLQGYIRSHRPDLERDFTRLNRSDLMNQLSITNNPFKSRELHNTGMFVSMFQQPRLFPTMEAHRIMAEHILNHLPQ